MRLAQHRCSESASQARPRAARPSPLHSRNHPPCRRRDHDEDLGILHRYHHHRACGAFRERRRFHFLLYQSEYLHFRVRAALAGKPGSDFICDCICEGPCSTVCEGRSVRGHGARCAFYTCPRSCTAAADMQAVLARSRQRSSLVPSGTELLRFSGTRRLGISARACTPGRRRPLRHWN